MNLPDRRSDGRGNTALTHLLHVCNLLLRQTADAVQPKAAKLLLGAFIFDAHHRLGSIACPPRALGSALDDRLQSVGSSDPL